jgi:hypothetical protein
LRVCSGVVVKALRYKPAGSGFNSQWHHRNFSVTSSQSHYGLFPGGKGGRCIRLTTLPPSCAVVMKSGSPNFLETSGPLQACNGIVLPFIWFYLFALWVLQVCLITVVCTVMKMPPSEAKFHLFHWPVQNSTIPCRSQELLPFLSVMYFFLPPFSTNYSSIVSPHLAICFLVYLSNLFPNSYIIPFWEFYFLPFAVHAQSI